MTNPVPDWAGFHALDWNAFALPPRSKEPAGPWKRWQTERSTPDDHRRWQAEGCNAAIVTGSISGFLVLDCDTPEAIAEAERLGLNGAPRVDTANGSHFYFAYPGYRIGNRVGFLPGMDLRGDGGFVVAPGSIHPNGQKYRWADNSPDTPLPPMPVWLCDLLRSPTATPSYSPSPLPAGTHASSYGQAALQKELAAMKHAPEGTRNDRLNKSAFALAQLAAGGEIDGHEAKALLHESAVISGLNTAEIEPTITSGWDAGAMHPRNAPALPSDPNEDSIGAAFTACHGQNVRYNHSQAKWWLWDNSCFRRAERAEVTNMIRSTVRRVAPGKRTLNRAAVIAGVERLLKADPVHATSAQDWHQDPMQLATPAGMIDLCTGRLRPARPDMLIARISGVAPQEGQPQRWLRFLDETLAGDAEAVRFLQQWCGYCLTGDTREHALLFCYGPGGNGKSVFLNTLFAMLGDYAANAPMEALAASHFDRHTTELAMLDGARLVTASETEEGRPWAEARVKQLTGGDPITARFMRQDNFTFRPDFKLTIAGNHAPALRNVDDAMKRRIIVMPFTQKPATPDLQLEEKLRAELGQILAWCIQGCLDWQANGLCRPKVADQATSDYFREQDHFGQWLAECCETGSSLREQPQRLFESWTSHAHAAGISPGPMPAMASRLRQRGFHPSKSNGSRYYQGLQLAAPSQDGAF